MSDLPPPTHEVTRPMFSRWLRRTRKSKQQTQRQAAAGVGVHHVTFGLWERGAAPSLQQMYRIADWSGASLDELRRYLDQSPSSSPAAEAV